MDIWFQDEARIGQQGTLHRLWAKKGSRTRIARQQQRQSVYLFGAVCPNRDKAVGLIMPQANTQAMQQHLSFMAKQVPRGRHGVLVLDRAGWHTTPKLKTYAHLSLLPLPPASPELNPTEQVWQQLRARALSNRCFKDYDDILESTSNAWNHFIHQKGAIKKLCSRAWATL